jgi:starch phosphorylase
LSTSNGPNVAYFSMEIALEPAIPTYSGGLGVLAGDTVRSVADLGIRMTAISLLHRQGFFRQRLGPDGEQLEDPDPWQPEDLLEPVEPRVSLEMDGRRVAIRAWRYAVHGYGGNVVPVYLLDTDLPENDPEDRRLTDDLYLGDDRHRLRQEVVLGLGGVALLDAVHVGRVDRFHLNEGHAALVALALLERFLANRPRSAESLEDAHRRTRERCVFTTHTPVPAGHDRFERALAESVLGRDRMELLEQVGVKDQLNMTELALIASRFVNGVAVRHGEVSRSMFPGYPIRSITNGVHASTWIAPTMHDLFDRHIPGWRGDPFALRYASEMPLEDIGAAHRRSKAVLLDHVREVTGRSLDPDALTLGFARRATGYKRTALIFQDVERLAEISRRHGPLQLLFAGKAHPRDGEGKDAIRRVFEAARGLDGRIEVVYLPNYGMQLGRLLVSGSDVWLNNPIPPLEASGTSGMKAALNGVPSLSVRDGWWIEGCIEGVTGWEIENGSLHSDERPDARDADHAANLYRKLDVHVAPLFYERPEAFLQIRRQAISLNGSFFNTHRMVLQYLHEAYLPA